MSRRFIISLTAATLLSATPVLAQGDATKGESSFRKCQACHVVADAEGTVLAGTRAKTGPNLYGIANGPAGAAEDFAYSPSLKLAGEGGLVWDEANFVAYVKDPTAFLRTHLDDPAARGKMTFKLPKEAEAQDIYAFLAGFSAPAADAPAADAAAPAPATN